VAVGDAVAMALDDRSPEFEGEIVEGVGEETIPVLCTLPRVRLVDGGKISSTFIEKDLFRASATVKLPGESVKALPSRSVSRSESVIISTSAPVPLSLESLIVGFKIVELKVSLIELPRERAEARGTVDEWVVFCRGPGFEAADVNLDPDEEAETVFIHATVSPDVPLVSFFFFASFSFFTCFSHEFWSAFLEALPIRSSSRSSLLSELTCLSSFVRAADKWARDGGVFLDKGFL